MYLTDGYAGFLFLNALLIAGLLACLALQLVPRFRRRSNPAAWCTWGFLACGGLYYLQYPVASIQEQQLRALANSQASAQNDLVVKSLRIRQADFTLIERAAYSCTGSHSADECFAPVFGLVSVGKLDFVELGENPIVRYELMDREVECTTIRGNRPNEQPNDARSTCLSEAVIQASEAEYLMTVEKDQLSWPSQKAFNRVSLIDVETMEVVDEILSWDGERPYATNVAVRSNRRGALTQLLTVPE